MLLKILTSNWKTHWIRADDYQTLSDRVLPLFNNVFTENQATLCEGLHQPVVHLFEFSLKIILFLAWLAGCIEI